jgi:hypothetical protein
MERKLTAEEIVALVIPEGWELDNCGSFFAFTGGEAGVRTLTFKNLLPPVEYEWVTDKKPREPKAGDWVICRPFGGYELCRLQEGQRLSPQLCFERREVKR